MQKKRHLSSYVIGSILLYSASGASAIGWAQAQQSAVLGQPLDFHATLRLDPGDAVAPECVAAEVSVGDQRVPPPAVRVLVDGSNPDSLSMRVLTSGVVDEPVVAVTLAIGCPARMSRRFMLLADPPSLVLVTSLAAAAVAGAAVDLPTPRGAPPTTPVPPARRAATPPLAARSPGGETRNTAQQRPAAQKKPRKPIPAPAPAPVQPAEPVARLQLDPAEPPAAPAAPAAAAVEDAISAVAEAASAARAAASAASSADQRIATLERTLEQLRADARAEREQGVLTRERAERASRWPLPMLLALLALSLLSGWLAWRLRALQAERQVAWRRVAAVPTPAEPQPLPPTSPLPLVTAEVPRPPVHQAPATVSPSLSASATAAMPATVTLPRRTPESAYERTLALPPQAHTHSHALPDKGAPRDVSIEELLDLEQQAEFFIVLGQDDAAIELLVEHLRNTGGGSPLPYLKLLEIYRRRNEREAYERTRARFNHRFNAYAPDWDADLQQGRSLEDYPGVLPRLQQVWPRPLDSMAELEALLFRKSRGELFELPAYREVLFLYSLARDLLDREAADTGNVDLLLPLADGGEFSATSPHPYFGLERDSVFDAGGEDRPTSPVDLDLSQPDAPAIVNTLRPKGGR